MRRTILQYARGTIRALGLAALIAGASGCSTFDADWDAAAETGIEGQPFAGRWVGRWDDDISGHGGPIRAIVTPEGAGQYRARFRAVYAGFIPYESEVVVTSNDDRGRVTFTGEEDLGPMAGGRFVYRGRIISGRLYCAYESNTYRGIFQMARP